MTSDRIHELRAEVLAAPTLRLAIAAAIELGRFTLYERLTQPNWLPEHETAAELRQFGLCTQAALLWRNVDDCPAGCLDVEMSASEAAQHSVEAHARANEVKSLRLGTLAEQFESQSTRVIAAIRLERAAFRREARTP